MKSQPNTSLSKYLLDVYVPDRTNLRPPTIEQMRVSIRIFDRFLGRNATLNDLDEETICGFKKAYAAGQVAGQKTTPQPDTICSKLRDIEAIWRTAWNRRHTRKAPRKITRPRKPKRQPKAYSLQEMRQIIAQVETLPGTVGVANVHPFVIERKLWWRALVLCYDGRALYLRAEHQKQHADQTVWPNADGIDAIEAIYDPKRPTLFWWPYRRDYLYRYHKRAILVPAGIEVNRTRKGMDQLQKYRRTGLSHVAAQSEDLAVKLAGHSSPAITRRNYLDPDIVNPHGAAALVPSLAPPPEDPDDPPIYKIADHAG